MDKNNQGLSEGVELHGYRVLKTEALDKLNVIFYELEHIKTGARHIHLSNDDDNNCFSVTFKTCPQDSRGVAHILEHTALCGSKNFPVRDPFFSMIKRSLNTFMNAFTASDWTMYPYCSQNKADFNNLLDIYLDASFFPELKEINFLQEGHRLEFEKPEDSSSDLKITGVVYNEMKGAMSSPSSVMHRRILHALYPTTTYHNNSGGEPVNIPELTYEQFVNFHKVHYHPSNAYFFTYGNLPLAEHLERIDSTVLSQFDKIDPGTDVPDEQRFTTAQKSEFTYPLDKNDDDGSKNFVAVSWLVSKCTNPIEVLTLSLLEAILLGHAGAPLNKALLESNLGKGLVSGTGYDSENRETSFTAGLEGVKESDVDKIEELVLKTLNSIYENGIDPKDVESAIHQLEISTREVSGDNFPYPLTILFRFVGTYLHDGDALAALNFDKTLAVIKAKINEGNYLEESLKSHLINNMHRVVTVLKPDSEQEERESSTLAKKLEEQKSKMTEEEKEAIVLGAKALKDHQDAPEDLSCLPSIALEDLERESKKLSPAGTTDSIDEMRVSFYEQATNGLVNSTMLFEIDHLTNEEVKYLPLFGSMLVQSGIGSKTYGEVSQDVSLYTGGISASPLIVRSFREEGKSKDYFKISGKCLERNFSHMIDLMKGYANDFNFSDKERVNTIVKKRLNSLSKAVVGSGHSYAMRLAGRKFSQALEKSENFYGVHQLKIMQEVGALDESGMDSLVEKLENIGKKIFIKNTVQSLVIGQKEALDNSKKDLERFYNSLRAEKFENINEEFVSSTLPMEAWTTTTPVSYVCKALKVPTYIHEDAPKLKMLSAVLKGYYLHNEIREKGGAYGGMCSYNATDGVFQMVSYRDPHIKRTRDVYEGIFEFLKSGLAGQEEVNQLIVTTFGGLDNPGSPAGNAAADFYEQVEDVAHEMKQIFRDGIFNCKYSDLLPIAEKYLKGESSVVVVTSEEILKKENVTDLELRTI